MDEKEFETIVRQMTPKLYRTAVSLLWNDADAADAIQEAILTAWQKRGSLRNVPRFEAWLTRILINECRSQQRRRRFRTVPIEETLDGADEPHFAPADTELRDALRALPEKLRLPLILHHLEGYDLNEVARMLRLSEPAVRGRIYQARKRLKAMLDEEVE